MKQTKPSVLTVASLSAAIAAVKGNTSPGSAELTFDPVLVELTDVSPRPWSGTRSADLGNVSKLAAVVFTAEERAELQKLEDTHAHIEGQIDQHCDAFNVGAEMERVLPSAAPAVPSKSKTGQGTAGEGSLNPGRADLQARSDAVINKMSRYAGKLASAILPLVREALCVATLAPPKFAEGTPARRVLGH